MQLLCWLALFASALLLGVVTIVALSCCLVCVAMQLGACCVKYNKFARPPYQAFWRIVHHTVRIGCCWLLCCLMLWLAEGKGILPFLAFFYCAAHVHGGLAQLICQSKWWWHLQRLMN